MTEIEEIKDVLDSHLKAYTEGDNDKADRLDKLIEEKSIDWLSSLITTIESQKEEIESLHKELDEALKVSEGRYRVAQKAIRDEADVRQVNAALLKDVRNLFQRFLDCGDYRASDALNQLLIRHNTAQEGDE